MLRRVRLVVQARLSPTDSVCVFFPNYPLNIFTGSKTARCIWERKASGAYSGGWFLPKTFQLRAGYFG